MQFPWNNIQDIATINVIKEQSALKPQVIFKHSTTCSISNVAKGRFERSGAIEGVEFHFLDLLNHRQVSQAIADTFDVNHESPQVLLISKGSCIYDESHFSIDMGELEEQVALHTKG